MAASHHFLQLATPSIGWASTRMISPPSMRVAARSRMPCWYLFDQRKSLLKQTATFNRIECDVICDFGLMWYVISCEVSCHVICHTLSYIIYQVICIIICVYHLNNKSDILYKFVIRYLICCIIFNPERKQNKTCRGMSVSLYENFTIEPHAMGFPMGFWD